MLKQALIVSSLCLLSLTGLAQQKPEVKKHWKQMHENVQKDIAKNEPKLFRKLNIYWTDKAPVLDGKMDESCWKDAEVANDFYVNATIFRNGLEHPANQTEVRVCYDASNLYLFYTCFDKDMTKVILGQPQDHPDVINVHADMIELFLDPTPGEDRTIKDRSDNLYFQLCANPLGSKYDTRGYAGLSWNPNWQVKTHVGNESWNVEIAIPFDVLSFPGKFTATPNKGDIWGALFARDQASLQTWSRWTSNGIKSNGGFHAVNNYGKLIFQGRKTGESLPLVKVNNFSPLNFGKNQFELSVSGKVTQGKLNLVQDGKAVKQKTLSADSNIPVVFNIEDGGAWSETVNLFQGEEKVYQFNFQRSLPYVSKTLAEIDAKLKPLISKFGSINCPAADTAKAKIKALNEKAQILQKELKSNGFNKANVKLFLSIDKEWDNLKYDVFRLTNYPAKQAAFSIKTIKNGVKVFKDKPVNPPYLDKVTLSAAGNDTESFQVVVIPFWSELKDFTVKISDLKDSKGETIKSGNVSCFEVGYVKVIEKHLKSLPFYNPEKPKEYFRWPDTLFPIKKAISLPGTHNTTLWFNVHCPAKTPAGSYHGTVTLSGNGQNQVIPITLDAYGFDIPKHPTILQNHWLAYNFLRNSYDNKTKSKLSKLETFLPIYEEHLKFMAQYRVQTFPMGLLWNYIKVYLEPDGTYTFDFSEMKQIIDMGKKYGANFFATSFGCNAGGAIPIYSGTFKVIERKTGKTIELKDCPNMKPLFEKHKVLKPLEEVMFPSPFYSQYLRAMSAFVKNNGLEDKSYFEMFDENQPTKIIKGHKPLRKIAPDLKLMDYGAYPNKVYRNVRAVGYEDIWAPGLNKFDKPENLQSMKERRQKYGERYGFYTCGTMYSESGRHTPYLKVYQSNVAMRVTPWYAWKYDCNNFLIFMLFTGIPGKDWLKDRDPFCGPVGYSPLIYPGKDLTFLPCIRLSSLRDGMEDYEYFKMLHDLSAYLDSNFPSHQAILQKINKELKIQDDIIKSSVEWTRDISKLEDKKARLAALIQETQKAIKAYPQSRIDQNVK
jgi:hypothetical protein